MTAQRAQCPTSDLWGDRHMVTDHRWTLTAPDGQATVLCSAACALAWICYGLPADAQNSVGTTTGDTTNAHARGVAA